ncbi:helix-turn-helix domain-containing protein [Sphingomonas sp. CD22]|uniref:winged helix-turn-helix transcriptional regulator n=1 Tax=Sphingomonas sp. CD22 TaxID=3100214 RepID=UPI002ADF3B1E|nr:helix-turn-helix domain-containing protein [Sphingomonas sp. CD22]MEA1083749.1 helix-turn-helix domain-containing protein [Sphingomonas sp. CD22]
MDCDELSKGACPLGRGIARVGDGWSMLVLRDVARGVHRFDALQKGLGIAPNILTRRLAALVEDGLLERRRYSERPPRHEYVLTAMGRDYLPVLHALGAWGARHFGDETIVRLVAADGHVVEPVVIDAVTGTPLVDMELTVTAAAP